NRQFKIKAAPLPFFACCPYLSAMVIDNLLCNGQAQSRPLSRYFMASAFEKAIEYEIYFFFIYTGSIVLDFDHKLPVFFLCHFQFDDAAVSNEFLCIFKEIDNHLLDPEFIHQHKEIFIISN